MKKLTRALFYALNIIVAAFAREPSCPVCSRYDYEERILERVLRNEMALDSLLAEIRQTNAEVKAAMKGMQEDKTDLATAMTAMKMAQADMKSMLDNAIEGGLLNISEALSEMTTNTSGAIQLMEKENKILKDQLVIPDIHFYARTPATFSLSSGQDIIFTRVEVNVGECYNVASGKFTVSVPGLYVFAVQYCVSPSQNSYIQIVKQGTILQRSLSEGGNAGYRCMTMQAFTRAAISDQIWVSGSACCTSNLFENSNVFTSFSGVLIHV